MISQSDIIKTLVNNNCTDETIMSTALSPNCNLTKLLEMLTEAERFDLALDLSMKIGLDVAPLCKTWALRSLKGRNFQLARDKFRHCFRPLRIASHRGNRVSTNRKLLFEILALLTRMDEPKAAISDEIQMIRSQSYLADSSLLISSQNIKCKPTLYAECQYYLREYGEPRDEIRFAIDNQLWAEAAEVLIEHQRSANLDKHYLGDILQLVNSTGHLGDMIDSFKQLDPKLANSSHYIELTIEHCVKSHKFNTLYCVQRNIGHVEAAARTQIEHFYLRKPVANYRELSHRMASLFEARNNYEQLLAVAGSADSSELRAKLATVELQIDITNNFSVNEVVGCIGETPLGSLEWTFRPQDRQLGPLDSPVTLLDESGPRRSFLAALVLVYFDLSCSSYFAADGLELANRLVRDYSLDKLTVFKLAMRIVIHDESCDIIETAGQLLDSLRADFSARPAELDVYFGPSSSKAALGRLERIAELCDLVVRDSIESCREQDYKMDLAKLLSREAQVRLYIEQGKLSNAHRLASDMKRPDMMADIIVEATKLNQKHVKSVCELWLARHEHESMI